MSHNTTLLNMKKSQAMTKHQFKQALEDILLTYFRDNQDKKNLSDGIVSTKLRIDLIIAF